jgi:hypothetical protein
VLQVIEQIRTEAHRVDSELDTGSRQVSGRKRTRKHQARSSTRVIRGFTSLSPRARSPQGASADKIGKLASRLQSLIGLAEGAGDRGAARRHVRMAEDSAAARAEGQGELGGEAEASGGQVDIDALGREVLSAVTRELEMRRERRMEEADERDFWW